MNAREKVEDAIRRLTDGSLTFRVEEDAYSVVAGCWIDGRLFVEEWPRWDLSLPGATADAGVRKMFDRMIRDEAALSTR